MTAMLVPALEPVLASAPSPARAARVDRVRAREARAMALACEQRARRAPSQATMYLREAHRLRREAAALELDASLRNPMLRNPMLRNPMLRNPPTG